jgi:hypothetical protein
MDAKKAWRGHLRYKGRHANVCVLTWPEEAWRFIEGGRYARVLYDEETKTLTILAVGEPGLEVYQWPGLGRVGVMFFVGEDIRIPRKRRQTGPITANALERKIVFPLPQKGG